jgi:DinB superfamily
MGILTVPTANTADSEAFDVLGVGFGSEPIAIQQLARVADQIRRITRDAEVQVLSRDKADLGIHLEPGSWCVAECLDHLTRTTRSFLPALSDAIAGAPKLTTNRPLRTGILPSLFIRNLNPPYRIRFKVLPQLTPQNADSETVWTAFVESQSQLLETVLSAAGLAIDKVRIKSPVYARISYNIYGAFRMLAAHQSRHLWQIEQILKALDNRLTSGIA